MDFTDRKQVGKVPGNSQKSTLEMMAKASTCFFCGKLGRMGYDFFVDLQYDLARSAETVRKYSAAGRICQYHLWQLASMASPLDLAPVLAVIAREAAGRWYSRGGNRGTFKKRHKLFSSPKKRCLICSFIQKSEARLARDFQKILATQNGRAAYEQSLGFCVHHTALVASKMDTKISAFILDHARKRFSELSQDLQAFSVKSASQRRGPLESIEKTIFSRALAQLAGNRHFTNPC